MPYADPLQRKACAKRYHSQPHIKEHFAKLQRERMARLYAEDPEKIKQQRRVWARKDYAKNRMKTILREARKRAKEKGVPFDITEDDVFIPEFCPVFGCRLEVGVGERNDRSFSLDRIVPELGYIKGNVRVISWRANRLKADATADELEKVLAYMRSP